MLRWLAYLIPANLFSFICYLTNPIVVLFCDEEGELPGILHYWQTWDDSCDSYYFMHNVVPSWLDYGWDEHYNLLLDSDIWTRQYNKQRYFSVVRPDATWTTKQKLQRYLCRVWWLTRNCAYGFSFYLLGADLTKATYSINEENHFYCTTGNKWTKPFCYKNEKAICKYLQWKIYIGWKTFPGNTGAENCMIANRFLIKVVLK